MYYTVQQILSHPLMSGAKVLSGEKLLSTCPVESVSVIELPVEQFVRRNEFVLTTGIGCGRKPDVFESFVQDIYVSKASALAIATGRHVETIPDRIISYSRAYEFPLIQLPWEIRFSDIIKTILSGINQWERHIVQKAEKLQREIINLYLNGKSLHDALTVMEHFLNARVYLLQRGGSSIDSSAKRSNVSSHRLRINQLRLDEPSTILTDWGTHAQIFPFHILNQKKGALIIETEMAAAPSVPRSMVEQIIIVLQLWFKKEQIVTESENRKKEAFMSTLIKGSWKNWETIAAAAARYRFSESATFICLVGKAETDDSGQDLSILKNDIEKTASECIDRSGKPNLCAFYKKYLVIFLQTAYDNDSFYHLIDNLEKTCEQLNFPIFSWGINDHPTEPRFLSKSYKNARVALEIGRNQRGPGSRSTFTDTGEFQMLSQLSKDGSAKEIMQKIIGPLVAYNRERGLDLFHTLTCYIDCQGNVSQTARTLSLQRQSLIYRLQKIEALTGKSLSKPDDLFLLQLCLKLWTISIK